MVFNLQLCICDFNLNFKQQLRERCQILAVLPRSYINGMFNLEFLLMHVKPKCHLIQWNLYLYLDLGPMI